MARRPKVKLNIENVYNLMKSPEVRAEVTRVAENHKPNEPGYEVEEGTSGRARGRTWIKTTTPEAYADNARNATLLRALDGKGEEQK
ncbi:hypothetical protein ATK23_1447 [Glutamicibacter mysorens]|uniref:Uncharacterized protein n=1 Tax=Glutamicibacter mysorens TaxID=257984 RepID=A0ABX4MXG6_9MICC|nr:hypothetical protein [Glutamicibacter mysorens]PJJ44219.1 hypothetical protein ATK23_1447 [Glutamicibacter mysorens]